ncbi:MAG TPA: secretin N-terminal domain-containing protein [Thermoanaerobaculia bacterium]|nr:secretin N-terminal domain-containing protein [Thermoanaerobaculia bacterium]
MNRLRTALIAIAMPLVAGSCAVYNAQQRAHQAEQMKNWDEAVVDYQKALELNPESLRLKIDLQRAKLEASRVHFEKGKSLRAAADAATGDEQVRLAQLAATELQLTVRLDPTNQYAAVEMSKVVRIITDAQRSLDKNSIEEIKKRAVGKAQPPVLNPASNQPISLSFPRETPVKDIYKALGNAYGINILFDQAVKNDPIAIELKDVTAQQALERLMQAANHFYKALDEHTIIVVPDNPQARRDYEDLVIRTFYLSNGDAEQVTNVVRTMLEARNVFPLKALNAITIRDTADKVRIAEKIIEANDKAKAEVIVDVELLQLDLDKSRNMGAFLTLTNGTISGTPTSTDTANTAAPPVNIDTVRNLKSGNFTFTLPAVSYAFLKSAGESQTLANPELRISEGEKATLHIGQRVPVPVSTFNSIGVGTTAAGAVSPVTSYQYQDVGIKVAVEPRVHHNREVTLKLTVEVSDLGPNKDVAGQSLPSFITRTIEDTIRLKDGETNVLAGLIQQTDQNLDQKTPFLGDIPVIGRLFTQNTSSRRRTDVMLTMTPHIIRIPDITDEDVAPMWVGTQNNITFRGVSPRIESQTSIDPFTPRATGQFETDVATDGRTPATTTTTVPPPPQGSGPNNVFKPQPQPQPQGPQGSNDLPGPSTKELMATAAATPQVAAVPRIAAQPAKIALKPGEEKIWPLVAMDVEGLKTNQLVLHYDPQAMEVADVSFGPAMKFDVQKPPIVTIDAQHGSIRIASSDGLPLAFASGGDLAALRVRGGMTGDTYLIIDTPGLKNGRGETVASTVSGGQVKVQ